MPRSPLPKTDSRFRKTLALVAAATAAPLALAGCAGNAQTPGAAAGPIQVTSTQTECKVSASHASSGNLTFAVKNDGTQAADFYLLADDGLRVIGEVENIGPGLSRNLVVTATAGKYTTACKPGTRATASAQAFRSQTPAPVPPSTPIFRLSWTPAPGSTPLLSWIRPISW